MRPLKAVPLYLVVLLIGLAATRAAAEPVRFSIPGGPADQALLAFSHQCHDEVLFSYDDLRKVKANAVSGLLEPTEALARLLKGTPYMAHRSGPHQFVVKRAPPTLASSVRGRLIEPGGSPARDIRVGFADAGLFMLTDDNGEYFFPAVPPGRHLLSASLDDAVPVRTEVNVPRGSGTIDVGTLTFRRSDDPVPMDPFTVNGGPAGIGRFDRSLNTPLPHTAAGNIDLFRTEDEALPYTIFNRAQISRSGAVNLNEFLQRELLDSDAATRPPDEDGSADAFSAGSSNLSLRGYNSDETIVLVNGRRLPEILTSGRDTRPPPPDVNFIPLSLVERIEVLPISASALYSGNPVGGVINIVLRPTTDDTELTTTYTNALGGFDAPQASISLQHGQSLLGGKLQVRLSLSLSREVPPTETELGLIRTHMPVPPDLSSPVYRATPNIRSADGLPLFGPGTSSVTSVPAGADGTESLPAFQARAGVRSLSLFKAPAGMDNSPNSIDYSFGRRQRSGSIFASATYDVTPWLQLGADGIISNAVAHRGLSVFTGDLLLQASSPFNPFGKDVRVSLNETAPALGEGYGEAHLDFSAIVLGALIKGPKGWSASLDAQYGRSITRYRGLVGVDSTRWQQLVDSGEYNPLRDTQVFGPPQAFYDKALIFYGSPNQFVTLGDYDTLDTAFRLTNTSLRLPTGISTVNGGVDYRRNHLAGYLDKRTYGDGSLAGIPQYWEGRTLERVSVFGELQAPAIPAAWCPSWIHGIETDLAARYDIAATSQESNLAPTAGLKINLPGGFALRGTIATSNRFPTPVMSRRSTLTGATGGGEVLNSYIFDPVRNESYTVLSNDAINTNLHPEAAVTRSIGAIFQCGTVHRFRLALDFSDTEKSGELAYLEPQQIVSLEPLFPGRVVRSPLQPGDTHSVGYITNVYTGSFNLARRHSQNWVASADYVWTDCLGGNLELYGRWFLYQRYDLQLLPTSPLVNELSSPDGAAPRLLRNRANLSTSWSGRRFGFGFDTYFFDSRQLPRQEWASQGSNHISSFWELDAYLQADLGRWLLPKDSKLGLQGQIRVNNLFDSPPPRYANDPSGAGVQPYGDWRGRVYSISVTAKY
ncbi:vitamin B12 transporter BtuB precursor [mine drainage metagenome]|uniref:Vitamin B12 transporter BtuB n=1 Tax=mine drainage metagenome TaxID=410659 RepID=A0A1J5TD97_9ZZZZ